MTLTLTSPEAITDKAGTKELEAPELALIFPPFEARSDISGTGESKFQANAKIPIISEKQAVNRKISGKKIPEFLKPNIYTRGVNFV